MKSIRKQKALNNGLYRDNLGYIVGLNGATIDDMLMVVNGYLSVPFEGTLYYLPYDIYNEILADYNHEFGYYYNGAYKLIPLVEYLQGDIEHHLNRFEYCRADEAAEDMQKALQIEVALHYEYVQAEEAYTDENTEDLMNTINPMDKEEEGGNMLLGMFKAYRDNPRYIVNIGLHTSANYTEITEVLSIEHVLSELRACYLEVEHYRIEQSDTEPTLIATVYGRLPGDIKPEIEDLADRLMQDCIAAYNVESQEGHLLGRYAEEWGTFNPQYFLI